MSLKIRSNLQAWYQSTQTTGSLSLTDLSGNGRTLTQGTTPPVVTADVLNGKQSVYFNGTKNPLVYSGTLVTKHIFIVASFDDSVFGAEYQGLLSDLTTIGLLVGAPTTNKFFDFSHAGGFQYRKFDIPYASNNQLAPIGGQMAIIEVSFATAGVGLDGIQIGQDRNLTARKWKGHFFEALFYSEFQDEFRRNEIYKHLAEEWHLWRQDANGVNVFPFPANHTRNSTKEKKVFLSEPYDGDPVALVRGNSRRNFEATFDSRKQAEYLAAEAFHEQHFPLTPFVYRDYHFYPSRDTTCRFTSDLKEQGAGLSLYSYAFTAKET